MNRATCYILHATMNKLVLIDGHAILHRAFYALPSLTSKKGEPINAVYGFVSMLLRVIQDLKPTHIAVAFDRPEPTFRHKSFKAYQAQRPVMDEKLASQVEKAKEVLLAMGICVYEKAGYEADDIIGTLARQAARKKFYLGKQKKDEGKERKKPKVGLQTSNLNRQSSGIEEVVIVTGDRDILQLVDDKKKIRVYLPIKGLTEAKLMDSAEVIDRLGVKPKQIPDYKALVGDQSDNYLGVKGIGPKTAVSLLSKFKSKKEIYRNLNKIEKKTREILEKGKEEADISYHLAKILTNISLDIDFNNLKNWSVYNPKVEEVFSGFGFKTLKERAKKVEEKRVGESQARLF